MKSNPSVSRATEFGRDGLSQRDHEIIRRAASRYPAIQRITLFGSRAMGTFGRGSDIDLALAGPKLTRTTLAHLAADLEESDLPFKVDLLLQDDNLDERVKQHILRYGKPMDWRSTTLGEVTSWMSGSTPSKGTPAFWGGAIPWLSAKSIKSFHLFDAEDRVTEAAIADGARLAAPGDILMLVRGMTLHNDVPIGIAMRPMVFNQDVKGIRGMNGAETKYIAYWLLAHKPKLLAAVDQASHGTGRLQTDLLHAMEIRLPPLPEQRAIAAVLGALDDKIEQNRRTVQSLERLARSIFRAWFVDFEPVKAKAAGATDFPSMPQSVFDTLPTCFVNSAIGPVPEGWEVAKLGDHCRINQRSVRAGDIEGEIEYVDISSVVVGHLTGTQRMPFLEAPSRARRQVRHGDTIWSCVRPNHRSYLFIHAPPQNRIVSTGFAVLSPDSFGPSFLHATTTQQEFVHYLVSNADGSAYPAVRPDHFASADVIVPPQPLRDAYEDLTMPLRDLLAAAERESTTLAELRDYLLPKLLSGSVRVEVAHG